MSIRAGFLVVFLLAPEALAQGAGAYFNVESPQRKPITTARVADHDYLVACNTPDGCIEIYDTHPSVGSDAPVFLTRVQTGAEPISVVYNSTLGRLFTCNFLGDSISVISLTWTLPSGPLVAKLERTTVVGDEPNHIAFAPNNQSLFVTLGSKSAIAHLWTADLKPFGAGLERFDLVDTLTGTAETALEDPCVALVGKDPIDPTGVKKRLFVLGHRGGKIIDNSPFPANKFPPYDFDVWSVDIKPSNRLGTVVKRVGSLGTTNFSMAFGQDGTLWTVGTDAQIQAPGLDDVIDTDFGFVQSKIWRVIGAGGDNPSVDVRDLNADETGAQVGPVRSIGQPTDLALYEPGDVLAKIYVTGFNRDIVNILVASASPLENWTIVPRGIPRAPGSTNPDAGPRGLALKYPDNQSGDPGARLYVLNRLDNSISVIRVSDDAHLVTFPLQRDPTPPYIRTGRQFLYSARFSGDGIVSCASCHIDGRSDFLNWNLSDNSTQAVEMNLLDGLNEFPNSFNPEDPFFPPDKGWILTQSLQGMVNFETDPNWERAQSYFTNEPLHWRADRKTFVDFQGAFTALLEADPTPQSPLLPPPDTNQMEAFRKYVFSIAYPPNPDQPATRTFSGTWVDTSESTGTGAQRGMKLFHTRRLTNGFDTGRSCVQCHWLPEGSNNKITLFAGNFDGDDVGRQPLESSATRLLSQKERYLVKNGVEVSPPVRTGMFGLLHQGTSNTLRSFVEGTFGRLPGQPVTENLDPGEAFLVASFVREMDTGVGPLVGQSLSINTTNNDAGDADYNAVTLPWLNLREAQAGLANHGLAVQAIIGGTKRGFWFDQSVPPPSSPVYREDATGLGITRSTLLGLVSQTSDLLVVHVTALGNERRVAWPGTGSPAPLAGAPVNVSLETAIVGTAYKQVPSLTKNWIAGATDDSFIWTGPALTPPSIKALRVFQYGLMNQAPEFGLSTQHHDAPRRFRISMDNGRHGAKLVFKMGVDAANPPPNSTQFITFELALHPTNQTNANGTKRMWETAAEAEPRTLYMMMLGGPAAPHVQEILDGTMPDEQPPAGFFYSPQTPAVWNQFKVSVRNDNGSESSPTWQALKIE